MRWFNSAGACGKITVYNMRKIKGVIFDLDGTIANTLPLCILAFRKSIEPLINRFISDEEIIATFGPSEEGTIMALVPNDSQQALADYLRYYEALHGICPAMFEGIAGLLDELSSRSVRLAMVTGKGPYSTAISLKKFNAAQYFSLVETGSAAGPRKPAGIAAVLEQWQWGSTEDIIYVGDAPGDIEACRQVGVPVIAAAWASTAEPAKLAALQPDALFLSVQDFSTWLKERI